MGQVITDDELVAASRRGEREAFGALVERHLDAVWAVSFSRTRDEALSDDVAQDTFVAAWAQLDRLREVSRVRAWLCGIARNLASKARRRAGRERPDAEVADDAIGADGSPFDALERAQTGRLLERALAELPDTYREALVLYYQHERSIRDVASALGIREEAAMQRLTRGRRLLAAHVIGELDGALAARRPRKALVAGVLAVLPPRSSTAIAGSLQPSSSAGATMLKLAAVILATAGLAGTTYAVTRPGTSSTTAAAAPSTSAAATGTTATASAATVRAAAAAVVPGRGAAAPTADDGAGAGSCEPSTETEQCDAPPQAEGDLIAAADIEATGLYRGPSRGPIDAPVQIAIFQDLQCQFCEMVMGTIDQLFDEYPGQIRLVVKDFPLPGHSHARLAAEAARAADAQGKLWEFREACLASRDDLTHDALIDLARGAGLDVARFTADLDGHRFGAVIDADMRAGAALEVQGTPAFFINGKRFIGARPIETFRAAIDEALAARHR